MEISQGNLDQDESTDISQADRDKIIQEETTDIKKHLDRRVCRSTYPVYETVHISHACV